jgi:hypothetical protein
MASETHGIRWVERMVNRANYRRKTVSGSGFAVLYVTTPPSGLNG